MSEHIETIRKIVRALYFFGLFSWTPVIYIWVIKPGKSLGEGLRDWIKESEDDI